MHDRGNFVKCHNMFTMGQSIILGTLQGVLEWLPVSSEGVNTLTGLFLFGKEFGEALLFSIWLHLGTCAAAIVYFWQDIKAIFRSMFNAFRERRFKPKSKSEKLTAFLGIATFFTGIIGAPLLVLSQNFKVPSFWATLAIGILLVGTGILHSLKAKKREAEPQKQINLKDGVGAGVFQGFSALPGLSRSGLTLFILLWQNYNPAQALRLSFLMSIPAVAGSTILVGFLKKELIFSVNNLLAASVAFLLGLVTIKILLKLAAKINFAYFCFILGVIAISFSFLL